MKRAQGRPPDGVPGEPGSPAGFAVPNAPGLYDGEKGLNDDVIDIVAVVVAIVIVTLIALAC